MPRFHGGRVRALRLPAVAIALALVVSQTSASSPISLAPLPSGVSLDRNLIRQLELGVTDRFVVEFGAKADLRQAHAIKDFAARGQFVVDALRRTAEGSQGAVIQVVRATPGASATGYFLRNVLIVRGSARLAEQIARLPGVTQVRAERVYPLVEPIKGDVVIQAAAGDPEWGVERIGADQAWAQGVLGSGVVVANIDTGVDYTHEALVNQYRGNLGDGAFDHNYNWWDPTGICGAEPCDNAAHGTHTMGTMVGGDGPGPFTPDIGVAPGASWIAAKGCEDFSCSEGALLSSGQFILAPTDLDGQNPDPSKRPDIVNNSWGGGPGDTFYLEVVQAWRAAGIFPVFANGNAGPECGSGGSPGDYLESFAVGATDIDDVIAEFSSRGPSVFDKISPDVSAPGVDVLSSVPGGGYEAFSGTSMATPHTVGAFALMLSAEPGLIGQFDAASDALRSTALDILDDQCGGDLDGDPNNVYGDGRIDAFAAVQLVATGGTLEGTITDADGGDPIPGARVTANNGEREFAATADGAGHYQLFLAAGSYAVSATAFGYETAMVADVVIETDQSTTVDLALTPLPRFVVSGHVLAAEDGSPIADATVRAIGVPVDPVETDASGFYSLTLPIGSYLLRASAGGCTDSGLAEVELVDADLEVDFALSRKIDDFGHGCRRIAFDWVDAQTQSALFGDEFAGRLQLPFDFPFYGETYGQVFLSDNGYLNFAGPDQFNFFPSEIPNPNPPNAAIYPLWIDMVVDGSAAIDYDTIGTAPSRTFVIEYSQVRVFGGAARLDLEVKLHEDGRIDLLYGDNPANPGDGRRSTIGIENADGTDALQFSFFDSLLGASVAYRYELVPSGLVHGTVTDLNDGEPIGGAVITATPSGRSATTGPDGTYQLRLRPGSYDLTAAATGYTDASAPVTVTDGSEPEVNFELAAPIGSVDPTSIEATAEFNQATTVGVTLSNDGSAPLAWTARERALGSTPPDLPPLRRFVSPGTWGGYRLPAGLTPASTSQIPSELLTTIIDDPLGDSFGNVDITTVRGGSDGSEVGLAIDFSDDTPIGTAIGVVHFDTDQDPTTGFPPEAHFGLPTQDIGVDYFAELFFIHDPDPVVPIYNEFFELVTTVPGRVEGQTLAFDVPLSAFGDDDGAIDVVLNTGEVGPEDWAPDVGHGTIEPFIDAPWMSADPSEGVIDPGQSAEVAVTLGGPGVAPGTYNGLLAFLTNDPKHPLLGVDVTLDVPLPEAFGAVSGAMADAHTGLPIAGQVILHAEWLGEPLEMTATSGDDGGYLLFAPEGTWPTDFTADGYVGESRDVLVQRGVTREGEDAALHRIQPHAQLDAGPIDLILLPGQSTQLELVLSNPEGHEDLAFEVLETPLAVATNARAARSPAAGVDSRTAPAGSVRRAAPRAIGGGPVLVFMDILPWDSDALLQVLDANGIPFDVAPSEAMGGIELIPYQSVFIANDQPQAFYDAYLANFEAFDGYVQAGGFLWFGAAAWGFSGGDLQGAPLPGGATISGPVFEDFNDVANPDHPMMQGVPDPFSGTSASHAAFENLPDGTDVIATGSDSGMPTLIEYGVGAGRVLGIGQTLEFAWAFGQDGAIILENGVPYAAGFVPSLDVPWLSVEPVEGSVAPDGSQTLVVTVDAGELTPGLFGARLLILTNDPDGSLFSVPVRLTVPAYRQGINAGGPTHTAGDGVTYAADRAFGPGGFGYVGPSSPRHSSAAIAGTEDDPLYQRQRLGMSAYRFAVPEPGTYRVELRFAELQASGAGQRVFSVLLEGSTAISNLDVFAAAGGGLTAHDLTFEVEVGDGVLDVGFAAQRGDRPIVNAILVTHLPDAPGGAALQSGFLR
ncbi:MAG: carboxypeptidase regulatory-like domain-containing protein [Candidatus Limnocylindria bacterium]